MRTPSGVHFAPTVSPTRASGAHSPEANWPTPSSTASITSGVAAANRSVAASSGKRTTCSSTKRCSDVGGVKGMFLSGKPSVYSGGA